MVEFFLALSPRRASIQPHLTSQWPTKPRDSPSPQSSTTTWDGARHQTSCPNSSATSPTPPTQRPTSSVASPTGPCPTRTRTASGTRTSEEGAVAGRVIIDTTGTNTKPTVPASPPRLLIPTTRTRLPSPWSIIALPPPRNPPVSAVVPVVVVIVADNAVVPRDTVAVVVRVVRAMADRGCRPCVTISGVGEVGGVGTRVGEDSGGRIMI
ncbi:hypothetical protein BC936DRAFT_139387, partial [Jimgerdemannia flammicorona]